MGGTVLSSKAGADPFLEGDNVVFMVDRGIR